MTMSRKPAGAARTLLSPLLPLAVWWLSVAVVTVASVQSLFGELPPTLQLPTKLTAYVSAATSATLGVGLVVAFGLCCWGALRWLVGTTPVRAVARSVCLGTWAFAASTFVVAMAVLSVRPEAWTGDRLAALSSRDYDPETLLGVPWLIEMQYVAGGLFLVIVFVALTRVASRINALISVVFATSLILFIGAVLSALASSFLPR